MNFAFSVGYILEWTSMITNKYDNEQGSEVSVMSEVLGSSIHCNVNFIIVYQTKVCFLFPNLIYYSLFMGTK